MPGLIGDNSQSRGGKHRAPCGVVVERRFHQGKPSIDTVLLCSKLFPHKARKHTRNRRGSVVRHIVGRFTGCAVLLLASPAPVWAQLSPCYAGFEISEACIAERGLDPKVAAYQRKITEAMSRLGASYKISLRPVNNPVEA